MKKADARMDWKKPAAHIARMIRAFHPWPSAWTIWPSGERIYRIRIEEGEAVSDAPPLGTYGYVWTSNSRYPMLIKAGGGSIAVRRLTLEGKKTMEVA